MNKKLLLIVLLFLTIELGLLFLLVHNLISSSIFVGINLLTKIFY
jgi:uncharacterized membrane-anchored protein YitT (DUF2179 family)